MSTTKFRFVHARKGNFDHDGNGLIQFRIYKHRKYRYVSTGLSVLPTQWSEKEQRVIKHPQQIKYNLRLQEIRTKAQTYHANYVNASAQKIKDYLLRGGGNITFTSFCHDLINSSDLESKTVSQERLMLKYLSKFSDTVEFSEIDYSFLVDFKRFLEKQISERGRALHPNYISALLVKVKKYVREAIRCGHLSVDPFLSFTISKQPSEKVALTFEELKLWEGCDVSGINSVARLQDTWLIFLFGCYTGLRFSDLMSLEWSEIRQSEKGFIIRKLPQKTRKKKIYVELPLFSLFQGKPELLLDQNKDRPLPSLSNKSFNDNIRTIAKYLGIEKHLTAHSSRHTFGTLLADKGVPIEIIRSLMGHSSVVTTEVYSKVRLGAIEKGLEGRF